jgi:hypothetical protein
VLQFWGFPYLVRAQVWVLQERRVSSCVLQCNGERNSLVLELRHVATKCTDFSPFPPPEKYSVCRFAYTLLFSPSVWFYFERSEYFL